jgi:putative methyltransferase (TIGR04325 family)
MCADGNRDKEERGIDRGWPCRTTLRTLRGEANSASEARMVIPVIHHPYSGIAKVVRMLEEIGVPYEMRFVDILNGAHKAHERVNRAMEHLIARRSYVAKEHGLGNPNRRRLPAPGRTLRHAKPTSPLRIDAMKHALKRVPLVHSALLYRARARFAGRSYGSHWGVFRSFEEARRFAPKTRPVGFDVPAYAEHHLDRAYKVLPYDYPVLFWLKPLLVEGASIFDFGGNVGVHYHGYKRFLRYPDNLRWTVCELPHLIVRGEALAAQMESRHLAFTERFEAAEGATVLIAAGVLQYIESPLDRSLAALGRKPGHILLNKLPLCAGEPFVTLQNAGLMSLPQHVFKRSSFLDSFRALGYEVVDEWEVPAISCYVPFHPDKSVPSYSGCYLRLAGSSGGNAG